MFASSHGPRSTAGRRGIVLVLVLGMLGLMALIGVTFAAFAGQSLKNGRNFAQGLSRPSAEAMMDYALAQLISDTNNPISSLRGHSLLRDMYGNDSLFRGSNPPGNSIAETKGIFDHVQYYDSGSKAVVNVPLQFVDRQQRTTSANAKSPKEITPFYSQIQYKTNIPIGGQYENYDFTRWIIQFNTGGVPQTFEVIEDDYSGKIDTDQVHWFTLSNAMGKQSNDYVFADNPVTSGDTTSFVYTNPNEGALVSATGALKGSTYLAREVTADSKNNSVNTSNAFILDGRYMRAFNGPGLTRPVDAYSYTNPVTSATNIVNYPFNHAAYGNMRVAGIDPDAIGMDEDYDACDLENWFLAIQSADGQVMIPSFHRPGILTADDWTLGADTRQAAKILRPRQADNSPQFPTDPSILDNAGKLTYDIDNDGDGVTDSVWLDLGYPLQRDPSGKLYKPLFAFMVLGLNGRLPLNTVGNLQARAIGDTTNNENAMGMSIVTYDKSSGQTPYPGYYDYTTTSTTNPNHRPLYSSQVFFDTPLYDHTSHLGYSVNEINPKFALQNAPSNLYPEGSKTPYGVYTDTTSPVAYTQHDDAGVSVALTQMRNILAGTIPTDAANPYTGTTFPINSTSPGYQNSDMNLVFMDNTAYILPNGVADGFDVVQNHSVNRFVTGVAGRWGESEGISKTLPLPVMANNAYDFDPVLPLLHYSNPVRAGRSYLAASSSGTNPSDALDDDFDSFDPYLAGALYPAATTTFNLVKTEADAISTNVYHIPLNSTTATASSFVRSYPEDADTFDGAGQRAVASERYRSFITPQDPAGVGRMVSFLNRPASNIDYGNGSDTRGRAGYFRYFRPAGLPQEIRYPYTDAYGYPYYTTTGLKTHRYLMPVLLPAGLSDDTGVPKSLPNRSSNVLHGYQAAATPELQGTSVDKVAVSGAMPFDYNPQAGTTVAGYSGAPVLYTPTIHPLVLQAVSPASPTNMPLINSLVGSETGPNVGGDTGTDLTKYPIPYVPGNPPPNGYSTVDTTNKFPLSPMAVNGYIGGSLNKDEADEMNLYTYNSHDQPYSVTDLEWLYRLQDVDGATLISRLSQLAPVSFLNKADGLTRRRLFSTDAWDLINFSYANDNPYRYAGVLGNLPAYSHSSDHDFTYNSRFMPNASPSLELMNQIPSVDTSTTLFTQFANPVTTEFLYNPTLPTHTGNGDSFQEYVPNYSHATTNSGTPLSLPLQVDHAKPNTTTDPFLMFKTNWYATAAVNPYTNVVIPAGTVSAAQVQTPSVAHRDRKINLNFPLPISNDPAEPIRQKWCRETYQLLKAILPPAAVDTPEELAALSQYVVNIIDFRDTDCTMTRFVNTDLVVTDALTKHSSPIPQPLMFDPVHNVSPLGVRFALAKDTVSTFPYDPALYNPNLPTHFVVQHGMEYNPIAINEVFAVQYPYGNGGTTLSTARGLFIELVNTLTEAQGHNKSNQNGSAVDLTGWDMIITPDQYGWGRPDPITGEVSVVAFPPFVPGAGSFVADNTTTSQQSPNATLPAPASVQQYRFTSATAVNNKVLAINDTSENYFIVGGYADGSNMDGAAYNSPGANSTSTTPSTNGPESSPVASGPAPTYDGDGKKASTTQLPFDIVVPKRFIPFDSTTVTPRSNMGLYYWVYLRRPANPFDTDDLNDATRPNREMVVVDAMRFPYIDAGNPDITLDGSGNIASTAPKLTGTGAQHVPFSVERLQPYRGGHLVPVATQGTSSTVNYTNPTTGIDAVPAATIDKIAPPTPAYAYGYSEQTVPPAAGTDYGQFVPAGGGTNSKTTPPFQETIGSKDSTATNFDSNWALFPFHDRDFSNLAELLLVPGCPPGLFTKQFVEEPYPGHAAGATPAKGIDFTTLNTGDPAAMPTAIAPLTGVPTGVEIGQANFGYGTTLPVPTYPYLTDNFYYTAASVTPPIGATSLDANYKYLTTEIGGWTGTGWHKILEFFEVPSSANGAIDTANRGVNYDWYRSDIKPGQLNLNLIIDDEVYAGLLDDPRINENLAADSLTTQVLPFVVSQIDFNGYPVSNTTTGNVTGRYPVFPNNSTSVNNLATAVGGPGASVTSNFGRGYVYRDPNADNYVALPATVPQQVHGMKAAFSDFLKLRHGGSGYLFAHGGGDVGMGDYTLTVSTTLPTQPIAADRPYRSLSYPDINFTIMRPASLPPSPVDPINVTPHYAGTNPVLPPALINLFTYSTQAATTSTSPPYTGGPYVTHNPSNAPLTNATPSSYIQDPGIKNPFLDIQFNHTTNETSTSFTDRRLAPPYDIHPGTGGVQPIPAPFPPTIPPTPARRLFQIPDVAAPAPSVTAPSSNASLLTQQNGTFYTVNQPVLTPQLWSATINVPPTLVSPTRDVFLPDNYTPQSSTHAAATDPTYNMLGAGANVASPAGQDRRQHPAYRTELLQKISNLTTVRTHQFAVWITVGFFEVLRTGTPELGVTDVLGQELGTGAGDRVRYRSFFVVDRTKATGFNPYYPGDFRDCVTYRRRIE